MTGLILKIMTCGIAYQDIKRAGGVQRVQLEMCQAIPHKIYAYQLDIPSNKLQTIQNIYRTLKNTGNITKWAIKHGLDSVVTLNGSPPGRGNIRRFMYAQTS